MHSRQFFATGSYSLYCSCELYTAVLLSLWTCGRCCGAVPRAKLRVCRGRCGGGRLIHQRVEELYEATHTHTNEIAPATNAQRSIWHRIKFGMWWDQV